MDLGSMRWIALAGIVLLTQGCPSYWEYVGSFQAKACQAGVDLYGSLDNGEREGIRGAAICPSDDITLSWETEGADSVEVSRDGKHMSNASMGSKRLTDVTHSNFLIEATGTTDDGKECQSKAGYWVHVVQGEESERMTLEVRRSADIGKVTWKAQTLSLISPKLNITAVDLVAAASCNDVAAWDVRKTDKSGKTHAFRVTAGAASTPVSFPYAGSYEAVPIFSGNITPKPSCPLELKLYLTCKA
jgi:hypothetical protein